MSTKGEVGIEREEPLLAHLEGNREVGQEQEAVLLLTFGAVLGQGGGPGRTSRNGGWV